VQNLAVIHATEVSTEIEKSSLCQPSTTRERVRGSHEVVESGKAEEVNFELRLVSIFIFILLVGLLGTQVPTPSAAAAA